MKWTGGKEAKQKAIERLKIALEKKPKLGLILLEFSCCKSK